MKGRIASLEGEKTRHKKTINSSAGYISMLEQGLRERIVQLKALKAGEDVPAKTSEDSKKGDVLSKLNKRREHLCSSL